MSLGDGKSTLTFFLAPTQNTPFPVPQKSLCASFAGKGRKNGTHINFFGGFGGPKGAPNGPFSATKSLVYCFFLPLNSSFRISGDWTGIFFYLWQIRVPKQGVERGGGGGGISACITKWYLIQLFWAKHEVNPIKLY